MGESFLIKRKNNATSKKFAYIAVTYPEDSTCTCTKGNIILTAKTTTGKWIFNATEAGEWTVSCTNGTDSKSAVVTVTEGDAITVELSYKLYLYNNGNQYTTTTNGWAVIGYGNNGKNATTITEGEAVLSATIKGSSTMHDWANVGPNNGIDLTEYSSIFVDLTTSKTGTGSQVFLCVSTVPNSTNTAAVAKVQIDIPVANNGIYELPISELEGNHYIALWICSQGQNYYWDGILRSYAHSSSFELKSMYLV